MNEVHHSTVISYSELKSGHINIPGPVRILYYTRLSYKNTAKMLGLMDDFKVIKAIWRIIVEITLKF